MNIAVDPNTRAMLNEKQKTSRRMTPEEKGILDLELTKSEYQGKSQNEILDLLNLPREVPNDAPVAKVPREFWAPDELKNLLMQRTDDSGIPVWIKVKRLSESDNEQLRVLGELILDLFTLKGINLSNPMVAQGLQTLLQVGVLDQALYDYITTEPDPSYQPVLYKIRAEELFGEGAFIEAGDLG